MTVRTGALLVTLVLLGAGRAVADHRSSSRVGPPAAGQVADAAFAAWREGRRERLRAIAQREDPDPWLVADELCFRGQFDAADAFAAAAPRTDVERLVDYVSSRRGEACDEEARVAVTAMLAAFRKRDWEAALDAAVDVSDTLDRVARIRIEYARGVALAQMRRPGESARHLLRSAQAARNLGWVAHAQRAYGEGASGAWKHADWDAALEAWTAQHAIAEARGESAVAADALVGAGMVHARRARYDDALQAQRKAMALRQVLGDMNGVAGCLGNMGLIHQRRGEYTEALAAHRRARDLMRDLGNAWGVATSLGNIGLLHLLRGRYQEARADLEQSLLLLESMKDRAGVARTLGNLGVAYEQLGDVREALDHQRRALALKEALRDRAGVASTYGNIGNLLVKLGDYPAAMRVQEKALAAKEALKDQVGIATTLGNLGVVHEKLGDLTRALTTQQRALELKRGLEDHAGASTTLGNLGLLNMQLGRYPLALRALEEALEIKRRLKDRVGEAQMLGHLGSMETELGDFRRALQTQKKALVLMRANEDRVGEAQTLARLGVLYECMDEFDTALAMQRKAGGILKDLEDRAGVVRTLLDIGVIHLRAGNAEEALETLQQGLGLAEQIGGRVDVARAIGLIGLAHWRLGDGAKALRLLERAVREARRLRAIPVLVRFLGFLAMLRLEQGQEGRALAEAEGALRFLEELLRGLDEEHGALTRARYADVFGVGALAAAALDEPAALLTFLESGRAGSLLESLDGRQALEWASLPEDLKRAEVEAEAGVRRSRYDYDRALETGRIDRIQETAAILDEALERLRDVSARIQREAKHAARLFYPVPATLEEVQANVGEHTALVLFGLCLDQALALVVTRDDARIVRLGPAGPILEACAALDVTTERSEYADAAERLRELLVVPLDLPAGVREVLLSPEGALSYIPFVLLFPKHTVAYTPSGTTYVLLVDEERTRGEQVLALGDPVYGERTDEAVAVYTRDGILTVLPGSRKEVEAIGDVILVGAMASEDALFEKVKSKPRWRAIHLACHGLVDPERPSLSSLAMTRHGRQDGFLTCLEVLRQRIPADLVVLSACETGRGRIIRGEGIVGLMRAFMYAGAPRVVCSLWKVDDEATLALMKRFYELWNPRAEPSGPERPKGVEGPQANPGDPERPQANPRALDAADALRQAQAFVRGHEGWEHPYYWAAWVLWGLPE